MHLCYKKSVNIFTDRCTGNETTLSNCHVIRTISRCAHRNKKMTLDGRNSINKNATMSTSIASITCRYTRIIRNSGSGLALQLSEFLPFQRAKPCLRVSKFFFRYIRRKLANFAFLIKKSFLDFAKRALSVSYFFCLGVSSFFYRNQFFHLKK